LEIHRIHPELLERQVRVLVVGCGGTGSAVVAGLPYLHQSLVAHGHPGGLHVTVVDADTISTAKLCPPAFRAVRDRQNKAIILVNRLNLFWGLEVGSGSCLLAPGTIISRGYSGDDLRAHIVVGAWIHGRRGLRSCDAVGKSSRVSYLVDAGNNADSGQFITGEP